jgi:lysophospholipase L1-like esterase
MKSLPLIEEWFHGAVSLEHREGGIKPWRIPYRDYDLYPPAGIDGKAEICAGVRLRMDTDAIDVEVAFTPLADAAAFDCVVNGVLVQTLRLPAGATEALFSGLPGGGKDVEIWLPQNIGVTVTSLRIGGDGGLKGDDRCEMNDRTTSGSIGNHSDGWEGDGGINDNALGEEGGSGISGKAADGKGVSGSSGMAAGREPSAVPLPDNRSRWITYGSSITQCVGASSPSRAWPAIAAADNGFNLVNLGFSGNCHMEPMIGRLIRDLPADFISLCVGVNIYGAGTISPRLFKPLLLGLLQTIRDKHRETPLLVISPIYGTTREKELNALGFTLPMMREAVREVVELLQERGDRHLHYRDGLSWLGPEDEALLADGLHPGPEGYELLGRRFRGLSETAFA